MEPLLVIYIQFLSWILKIHVLTCNFDSETEQTPHETAFKPDDDDDDDKNEIKNSCCKEMTIIQLFCSIFCFLWLFIGTAAFIHKKKTKKK